MKYRLSTRAVGVTVQAQHWEGHDINKYNHLGILPGGLPGTRREHMGEALDINSELVIIRPGDWVIYGDKGIVGVVCAAVFELFFTETAT